MPRVEKTVFISYRRTNFWIALAIFQNLHANGYDVFFDYKSIPSGDFEQVIIENVKSRAHFIVILTPSALERCHESGDWLRREIETAIDSQRNIIPLMVENFDFGSPATVKALTGKLENLKKYNALGIPAEYFDEAMIKLRSDRFLNRPLESVSHPVSEITRQITEQQKIAASETNSVEKEQLTAQEWFERGYVFQNDNKPEEAIRCYNEALHLQPDLPEAHNNLGILWKSINLYEKAEAAYRRAIELDPLFANAYNNFGNLLCNDNLKRYDEAEAAYRKAIDLNPSYASAYNNFGNLLCNDNLKRYDEAEAVYRKAIELNASDATVYSNLGLLLHENLKRYEEAEMAYRKSIELDLSNGDTYYNLGNLLSDENLKRYEEAEVAYHKAIELNQSDATAYHNLANLLKKLKRYEEAEVAYHKAIELNPSEATVYGNLGNLLRDKFSNRDNEAEVAYQKVVEINPLDHLAFYNLGVLYTNQERYDEADAMFAKTLELDPLTENALYGIARIRSIRHETKSALVYLKEAIAKGFDRKLIWNDPDLAWIRDDPRFAEIVGPKPEK